MASTHKSLRSGTANKRPTTSIADGQIALNTNAASPGLYFKDSTGASIIKIGPVHVGTTAPNVAPAGSSGNSTGEAWLDTSLTPNGWKVWTGAAWTNATPVGSDTVQGLLELATNAETQAGSDTARAVTPAGLQSKVSDSTSTTSSTTIASSTAVKSAYDLANAALPKSGGTVTGNLEIGTSGSLTFEGATADAFETTLAVVDPTADRTITFPDTTGTVVTTGDTGTVTSAMIANSTIVDADISASAEIAVSKLADGAARQLLQTDAAGTGVEWTTNVDVPGTLDVTGTTTLDSTLSIPLGSAASPTVFFTGDSNTGIYSPGADQVAISTGGSGRLFVDASGRVGVGTSVPDRIFHVSGAVSYPARLESSGPNVLLDFKTSGSGAALSTAIGVISDAVVVNTNSTERFRITSAGLVGVGTSSPNSFFHVKGGNNNVANIDNDGSQYTNLGFSNNGTEKGAIYWDNSNSAFILGPNAASSQLLFRANNAERARIDSSGRLGIGTSSPSYLLDANGEARIATRLRIDGPSSGDKLKLTGITTGSIYSEISNTGNTTIFGNEQSTGGGLCSGGLAYATVVNAQAARPLQLATSNTARLTIDSSGRVGIGTTSPDGNLTIGGLTNTGGQSVDAINVNRTDGVRLFGVKWDVTSNEVRFSGNTKNYVFRNGSSEAETARIDSSGRLLVGTSTDLSGGDADAKLQVNGDGGAQVLLSRQDFGALTAGTLIGEVVFRSQASGVSETSAIIKCEADATQGSGDKPGRLVFSTTADGASSPTEAMRISNTGSVLIQTTSIASTSDGCYFNSNTNSEFHQLLCHSSSTSSLANLYVNRQATDGTLIDFRQADTTEGTISVSGTTVSYNGGHLSRWSQLPNNQSPSALLKGTLMSNLDEMCEWGDEDNEQLNKTKISDTESDPNVAGLFVSTSFSEEGPLDFLLAMTGDMIIRIAEGVTVERGDLLMSAGDGTAKAQGDDIIRSKTIAKVTSTNVSCTYEDGSYCVPCVLMAC
jgi:hypothetical protein